MSNLNEILEGNGTIVKVSESGRSDVTFSHAELVEITKEAINKIIERDPLFAELPPDATLEEIKSQTAVVQGQAINVYLNRGELPTLAIVVSFYCRLHQPLNIGLSKKPSILSLYFALFHI